jgi:hypothetical protein
MMMMTTTLNACLTARNNQHILLFTLHVPPIMTRINSRVSSLRELQYLTADPPT